MSISDIEAKMRLLGNKRYEAVRICKIHLFISGKYIIPPENTASLISCNENPVSSHSLHHCDLQTFEEAKGCGVYLPKICVFVYAFFTRILLGKNRKQ